MADTDEAFDSDYSAGTIEAANDVFFAIAENEPFDEIIHQKLTYAVVRGHKPSMVDYAFHLCDAYEAHEVSYDMLLVAANVLLIAAFRHDKDAIAVLKRLWGKKHYEVFMDDLGKPEKKEEARVWLYTSRETGSLRPTTFILSHAESLATALHVSIRENYMY